MHALPYSIWLTLLAGYVLLDLRLLSGFRRLRKAAQSSGGTSPECPSVTVLVAARNEEDALPRLLDALLLQEYPRDRLQVVVVNDRSTDGTGRILREYASRHPGFIEYTDVERAHPGMSPKKNALKQGLECARGEWVAVTDADCVMGAGWLSSLAKCFREDTGMVLGLTAYVEPEEGFPPSEGTRALEFVSYGLVSAALVGLGFPVIANANNLAYRRTAFEEAGGFDRHAGVVSGDDDFTLQEIHATGRWKTLFCAEAAALVRTRAPGGWGEFWEQRKRWASKCLLYRPMQVFFLGVVFLFYASIPALLVIGLWNSTAGLLGLSGFAVKTAADYGVMRRGLKLFGLSPLLRHFPGTALLHIPLLVSAVVAGTFGGFTWKGQKLARKM